MNPLVTVRGRSARSLLRRVRESGPRGMLLLLKAFALLVAARAALYLLPIRRVVAWKQRPHIEERVATPADLEEVRRAILTVAHWSPLRFVCFPQCLAAAELLRGRGIASRLHYGAARADGKLVTHTWLEAEGAILIGGEDAARYSELAVY